jgi:hypothetical protein
VRPLGVKRRVRSHHPGRATVSQSLSGRKSATTPGPRRRPPRPQDRSSLTCSLVARVGRASHRSGGGDGIPARHTGWYVYHDNQGRQGDGRVDHRPRSLRDTALLCLNQSLEFTRPVTLLVGDSGSGKSTLVEAIAEGSRPTPTAGEQAPAPAVPARPQRPWPRCCDWTGHHRRRITRAGPDPGCGRRGSSCAPGPRSP